MSDQELLKQFQKTGCEAAFRALVDRYSGLVYSVALRRTANAAVAEEVVQNVFVILAAKSRSLKSRSELASWLHRTSHMEASNAARKEQTLQRKKDELIMLAQEEHSAKQWEVGPELDEALDSLQDSYRSAILLRFYDGLSYREMARVLNKTEVAVRQQVSRALSKLNSLLKRRGITTTGAALGGAFTSNLSATLPVETTSLVAQTALASSPQVSNLTLLLNTIQTMTFAKTKTAIAVTLLAAIPIAWQWNENRELQLQLSAGTEEPNTDQDRSISHRSDQESFSSRRMGKRNVSTSSRDIQEESIGADVGSDAWQQALYEQDPLKRSALLAKLLENLDPETAPGIAELLFKDENLQFASEHRLFLRAWAQKDGLKALEFIKENVKPRESKTAMLAALGGWASSEPYAASAWAESIEDPKLRENLLLGVIDGWSLVDFKAAASYAETRPRSEARLEFIQLLVERSMAGGNLENVKDWFAGISRDQHNEIYREKAFDAAISSMLYRDPAAAAEWISREAEQEFVSSKPVVKTALKLAEESPEEALKWLTSMPDLKGEVNNGAYGAVLAEWAHRDVDASGIWLGENSDHPQYDAMAGSYAMSVAGMNRETAREWAESIGDDEVRQETLAGIESRGDQHFTWGDSAELGALFKSQSLSTGVRTGVSLDLDNGKFLEITQPNSLEIKTQFVEIPLDDDSQK